MPRQSKTGSEIRGFLFQYFRNPNFKPVGVSSEQSGSEPSLTIPSVKFASLFSTLITTEETKFLLLLISEDKHYLVVFLTVICLIL